MNSKIVVSGQVRHLLVVLAGAVAVALPAAQPALAASPGDCVTALVDAPFRLPDGLLYPAGALTLCDNGRFSPVDNFHRILVGGSSIGLFRSRRRSAEIVSMVSPEVLFNRDAEGNLELIGYALPSSGHVVAYRLKGRGGTRLASSRRSLGGAPAAPLAAIVATPRTH